MSERLNLKVFAYIVRADGHVLVAATHNAAARGKYEVVRGRVESFDESLEAAARREVLEEAGIPPNQLERIDYLGINFYFDEEQHAFAFRLIGDLPETFQHSAISHDEDHGRVFDYRWLSIDEHLEAILCEGCNTWARSLVESWARQNR